MITVRNGNKLIKVPRPAWAIPMYPYPKWDPRYRVLLRFYLSQLPKPPKEKEYAVGSRRSDKNVR